ncbi:HNH endonuclease [Pseudomonas sp. CCC3.1]|uniref:HNH endonuclease n=1 Tax=Pseudomonas sp. CCC3.1 TaxID=3048607 RepID=UPI002AC8E5CC|nr:HNH endonuclease [Pseudomonas sp. CCC3.1]MEB0206087.1 HNH endonuclease [Pseudomonas sp. CCC3.1]WPX38273.1 HNH endonuclease [Pseudomonas sp. CCC3.1]
MSDGWSHEELEASVQAYREMLEKQAAGIKFVKKHIYRGLAERFDRKAGAFERRMQNISAIYEERGLKWVLGLKPQKNIGSAIKAQLIEMLDMQPLGDTVVHELAIAETEAEQQNVFDPKNVEDARKRVVASIVRRRGQSAFRKKLLAAYDTSCAITGCNQAEVLEAAHIHPYKGQHTHVVSNGLLLRADLHTLFDLYLIAIEPSTQLIHLAPALSGSDYAQYQGLPLKTPTPASARPSVEALQWHADHCTWFKSPTASSG